MWWAPESTLGEVGQRWQQELALALLPGVVGQGDQTTHGTASLLLQGH